MSEPAKQSLWYRIVKAYVTVSYKKPWLPLAAIIAVFAVSTWLSGHLRIDMDLRVLLPNGTPSKVALQTAEKRMGSTDLFTIAFEAPSAEAVGRFQKDIAEAVSRWPEAVWVQYDQDRTFFEKHALLYMPVSQLEDLRERISGMIGGEFAKKNPLIESLDDEDAEKPSLKGWPNADSLRKQGLPKDLVDALLSKVNHDAGATPAATPEAKSGEPPAPERPDTLKSRLMGWHPEKKVWVGVILGQLNRPSTDAQFAKQILERGTALIDSLKPESYDPGLVAKVAGAYRNFKEISQVNKDIISASIISLVLMIGLLWFFVRKIVNLIIILPLFVAMSWTTGLTYVVFHRLTLLTAFILALIAGLGIEYTVHLYSRWAEESRKGLNALDAMIEAVESTGRSLLSGAATNIVAMLSLQVAHFKGFKEFGWVVTIGITFALLTTWLVIPPLFFIFIRASNFVNKMFKDTPLVRKVTNALLPGSSSVGGGLLLPYLPLGPKVTRGLFLAGLAFTVGIAFGPPVKFESDFKNLRGKSTGAGISYGRAVGGGRNTSPSVILGKDEAQMRSVHDSLAARYGNPADSMMQSYATIQSFVPKPTEQVKRKAVLDDIKKMLDARALERVDSATRADLELLRKYLQPDTFGFDSLPGWAQRFLTEADHSHGRFGYLYGDLRESDALESGKFQDRFGVLPSSEGPVAVASSGFIYADVVRMVKQDGVWLGLITTLLLIVIIWLDMRSAKGVLICFGFIALSSFWTYKLMGLMGLKLGMFNLVVLPTILSVSVDSIIHLYHRRMELGAGKLSELYHTTGSAVLTGTLNNGFGFLGLCFVTHKGMQTIGFLATLGIGSGLVIMFTMLPFMLEFLCPKEPQGHE